MRRSKNLAMAALLFSMAGVAQASLLWDNFHSGAHGYDSRSYVISELDSTIPGGAWGADDAVFNQAVTVQEVRWAGGYLPNHAYTAEVMILNSDYSQRNAYTVASPTYTWSDPNHLVYGFTPYNGQVTIPDTVLPAGHYFFAVRLVNTAEGALGAGRNVFLTTGNGAISGESMALIQAPDFGYPTFVPVNQFYGAAPTDLAFQVYGVVPEPAALGYMALATVAMGLRRR